MLMAYSVTAESKLLLPHSINEACMVRRSGYCWPLRSLAKGSQDAPETQRQQRSSLAEPPVQLFSNLLSTVPQPVTLNKNKKARPSSYLLMCDYLHNLPH